MRVSLPRKAGPALVALLVVAVVPLTACSGGARDRLASATATSTTAPSTTTTTTAPTTTTTAAPTTTTAPPGPPVLATGSKGPDVLAMEQRLAALHYDVGAVDGVFDSATYHAVMAFEKVNGMARTGKAPEDVAAAIQSAGDPAPMLAAGGATRVEIDLKRQVLFLYKDGALLRILSVSTGSGQRYCVNGACDVAVTPGGSFRVGRKIKGLHISPLGQLWNPLFFNGGIAIHGSPSVPATPASHGCVRIPMNSSPWFYDTVASGTPVYVIGGPKAPVPFNEPEPPAAGSDTTTTAGPAPSTTEAPTTTTTAAPTTSTTAPPTSTTEPATTTTTTSSPPPTTP